MASQKFKSGVSIQGGSLTLPQETASRALQLDGSGNIQSSSVTNTELGYVSGVTSAIQTQLNTNATAISDHIADAVDAHDASAISNVPSGNLAATNQQTANDELQSDIDTRALDSVVIKKDGSVVFTADQSMGGFKLTNVATPVSGTDASNKNYVDSVANGLDWKNSVRAATVAAGILASGFENLDIIDGVTLATGDRILIKDQAAGAENGIYTVNASGAPTRAIDADVSSEVTSGLAVFVEEGTTNADSGWVLTTNNPITLGTTALVFTQFSGAGQIVAGAALTKTGNTLDVAVDGQGLEIVADQLTLELDGSTLSKSASGLKLSNTAVTPGSFGTASQVGSFTVDQQGRLTAASNTAIAITASQVTDFNEAAQDAVGTILVDTASINATYTDATPSITFDVLPAGVDHDQLLNFVANKHIDHSTVSITTGSNSGLSGGGDITATRSLVVDITGTTAETVPAAGDEILIYDISAAARRKMTRANFLSGIAVTSAGDIAETSFSAANNQAVAANVTGLAFANGVVRSFKALVSVTIDATADLFEVFELIGIQKGASWDMSISSVGDTSGIVFSITTAGQVQYTSTLVAGFVSDTMKFRAETTSV